jgi:hypothetical protein
VWDDALGFPVSVLLMQAQSEQKLENIISDFKCAVQHPGKSWPNGQGAMLEGQTMPCPFMLRINAETRKNLAHG